MLDGLNSRVEMAEIESVKLKRGIEFIHSNNRGKNRWKKKITNIDSGIIYIIKAPEEEEKENGAEKVLEEIKAEITPNLGKDINLQTQETKQSPNRIISKISTPMHVTIKLQYLMINKQKT